MSKYSTGEMAKLCEVSVRTVQFYDTKGLLIPSDLTEGGRRIYSDDDLKKLRLICVLKSLGLSLESIKGILESEESAKILQLLLDKQAKLLTSEVEERQKQLKTIEAIKESVRNTETIPVNTIIDIDYIMKNAKKLRKTHIAMFFIGLLMNAIIFGSIALLIMKDTWLGFAAGMPAVILLGLLMTGMYYKKALYICPKCDAKFKPTLAKFIFSNHTPKTRKLVCNHCGYSGFCVETSA